MSSWFRSELMEYVSLIVNEDAAHSCLADLGKLGVIQFTDLNPELTPFQRRFVSFVKRCDELERKLRFFVSDCEKFELEVHSAGKIDEFLNFQPDDFDEKTGAQLLESLEVDLEKYEKQLRELNTYNEKLTTEYNEKVELQEVLEKGRRFFASDPPTSSSPRRNNKNNNSNDDNNNNLLSLLDPDEEDESDERDPLATGGDKRDKDMRFSSITGVVPTEDKGRFERMIFRSTRGNCYVRFAPIHQPITDPRSGKLLEKCVFIIFYKSQTIEFKIKKICDAFEAHRYVLPALDDPGSIERRLTENAQELVDSRTVLLKNQDSRFRLCQFLATRAERWTWIVLREKAIYHSLNQFKSDVSGMLRGEGWVIANQVAAVKDAVNKAHSNMDMAMPSLVDRMPVPWPTPPTHFSTNKFTYGYQEFVNTYGIPRYREANPALFTAATFPFLFGVMYGDVGHGLFLFCTGLWLIYNEKKHDNVRLNEMFESLHLGRYMLVMMGFFAVYAGLIYNDCFSLGLNLFGSKWEFQGQDSNEVKNNAIAYQNYTYGSAETVYPFGLDPMWHISSNELLFFNSFKMKISVIFGITQMFAGTLLKGSNALFFRESLDFFFEFLPMVAFAASLFIYMVVLIIMKWSIDWNSRMMSSTCITVDGTGGEDEIKWGDENYNGVWGTCASNFCTPWGYDCEANQNASLEDRCLLKYGGTGSGCQPPNLITTLINIALQPGNVDEPLYSGQGTVQLGLLAIAFFFNSGFTSRQTLLPIKEISSSNRPCR
mmetsp:Transcript_8148/g.9304  ORF Transcript_8148/g.9304 Transcript_8148/m.9304 type:complete len:769 (-) Transcript_8148:429-2735(-)